MARLKLCLCVLAIGLASSALGSDSSGTLPSLEVPPAEVGWRYTADWQSLDSRPLPKWYDDAKFGIFIHWGTFSVPSYGVDWFPEWYWWSLNSTDFSQFWGDKTVKKWHEETYGKDFLYQDFAAQFEAKQFDPDKWADLFKNAGAKYVVLTSKHHEGYTLWPSKYSWNWNAGDIGPHRDLVGELTKAVKAKGLTMGLYHSMFEWFHPLFLEDKKNNFTTRKFPSTKTIPELIEIVEKYEPEVIWSDGEWDADAESYWGSLDFLAWLFNDSPVKDTVVVNDRWGNRTRLTHGSFFSGEDRQEPSEQLLGHKWESCMSIDAKSWGYNRVTNLTAYMSATEILQTLISTVAFGGNMLLNVGPTKEGIIMPIFQERLTQVGDFLKINGEAVYGSRPCVVQNETALDSAYYTVQHKDRLLYLTIVPTKGLWPRPGTKLDIRSVQTADSVELLTAKGPLAANFSVAGPNLQVTMMSAYDAGLVTGDVDPRGFSLRIRGALMKGAAVTTPEPAAPEINA